MDHGEAIKTSDFLGPTSEDIVISPLQLDPSPERFKRASFHWGDAVWIRRDPGADDNIIVLRAAGLWTSPSDARLQSVVPLWSEGATEHGGEVAFGALLQPTSEGVSVFYGSATLVRVPWEIAEDRTLAWTVTVNAETYELERDGDIIYSGPEFSLEPITTNSVYRVRAVNVYGEGPWSLPFALISAGAGIAVDTRPSDMVERDAFVHVNVSVGGGGKKVRSVGAGSTVAVNSGGGGARDGVNAAVLVQVEVGGGGVAQRFGGAGSQVDVRPETGYHPGAIYSLGATSGVELAFIARVAQDATGEAVTSEARGRLRRRRQSVA